MCFETTSFKISDFLWYETVEATKDPSGFNLDGQKKKNEYIFFLKKAFRLAVFTKLSEKSVQ